MAQHNHSVLCLSPYLPKLNPIEKIWAQVMHHVASHNVAFNFIHVLILAESKFSAIGEEEWKVVCSHVKKVEDAHLEKEPLTDEVQELIFSVNTGESGEESDWLSEDEDLGCSTLE